ncbi:MAG: hypothetical protein HY360_12670 [Verrucomicrobia bacterium]|nr:hypothetical protein [Verrucomicrobiota bacterium]
MIQFPRDFKEFLALLNSKGAEYLVVGGYAVGYHGYPRATGDLDIWIAVSRQNAQKMVGILKEFGFDPPELKEELFTQREKIIRMGYPPLRLEILTSIDGVEFEECYRRRIEVRIQDVLVQMISRDDLIRNKKASRRHKDLDDLEKLEHS